MPISYIHNILILNIMRIVWLNHAHRWKNRPASIFQPLRTYLSVVVRYACCLMFAVCGLTACQQEEPELRPTTSGRGGVLEVELLRGGRPVVATRAVDNDLVVEIWTAGGALYKKFEPGTMPNKIEFADDEIGHYILKAYTDNQTNWPEKNNGKGEGCYYGETEFDMDLDIIVRLTLDVPMTNYAVSLKLPELFTDLFTSYTFTVKSGMQTLTLAEGEKAYLSVSHGFSFALEATNADGKTSRHSALEYPYPVEAGKLYTVRYSYSSDATKGGADVEVTDDMEDEDKGMEI